MSIWNYREAVEHASRISLRTLQCWKSYVIPGYVVRASAGADVTRFYWQRRRVENPAAARDNPDAMRAMGDAQCRV
jgi:hypothetical protein